MRMRSHSSNRKPLLYRLIPILMVPVFVYGSIKLLPWASSYIKSAACLSAAFVMPEGGVSYMYKAFGEQQNQLQQTQSPEEELSKPSQPPIVSEIPSQEPSQEEPSQTQEEVKEEDIGGKIISTTYDSTGSEPRYACFENGYIKNTTELSIEKVKEEMNQPVAFSIDCNTNEPQVLIMHTHATESYASADSYYLKGAQSRTIELSQNVTRVGDEIGKQLDEAKIAYVHDKTLHDHPSYNGSYDKSRETVQKYLEQYPSIKVVLDIHRDAISKDDGTWIKPVVDINGKKAAQIMIIAGCDDGTMNMPNWNLNLRFAAKLQSQLQGDYPGLTRPVLFSYRKYNQDLTNGSLLIEMGSHGNTLEEAVYAGELVGKSLAKMLASTGSSS